MGSHLIRTAARRRPHVFPMDRIHEDDDSETGDLRERLTGRAGEIESDDDDDDEGQI
jgi:hypothetical protein